MWFLEWLNKILFAFDVIGDIKDIFETWKDKEEKIFSKIIFTIIAIGFIFLGMKLWL
ncbi:hypothetical protein [Clostridium tarantellae]|uniref:hypothetical protein n=1 Tax=Clostridium tarantellae TaxID=39493 RepID=UPI0014790596|nr:hypothetical protein [Clostridium tarantellae]